MKTNRKAKFGLGLGILSILIPTFGLFIGIIGLIVSRQARKEIQKTNENGDKLAKAGFVLSIIGLVLQAFLITVGILSLFQAPPA
ncbi:DUF4190 domain-containing protein [Bacillus sp. FJAT-45037]|uniref:DUF4190 domain-containing protein n=1 Tax=Bacillus sp. FJAT-45037 TaxID=2011007 RepID=UPI000C23281C|nr:DUF4190 domain-containing protein [Bacillus sp. FJAT-45037]